MKPTTRFVILALAAVLVGAFVLRTTRQRESPRQPEPPPQTQRRSTHLPPYYADVRGLQVPSVLAPELFGVPKTRASYQVAGAIPQALMQLPCYCWCDRIDHKSLLDCFVDEHAEFCDICQNSALWAEKRLREQAAVETIRQEIVHHYSRDFRRK